MFACFGHGADGHPGGQHQGRRRRTTALSAHLIDAPQHGIEADLLFRGRAPAQEEPRFTRRLGAQLFMDYTRLTQNGSWEGWIKHQGRIEVAPVRWLGTRDRSGVCSRSVNETRRPILSGTVPAVLLALGADKLGDG